jgi:tetratricopeptide (TPR) repeat protein
MSSTPRGFGADTPAITQRLRQAMELHQRGDVEAAIRIYGEVLERFPDHPDVLHYLGMAHYKRGDLDRARALMRRSIELDGRRAIVHVNLGRTYLNVHEYETAAAHFRRALEVDAQDWEALHMAGRAALGLRDTHAAVAKLEQAARRRQGWAPIELDLAHAYGAAQRHPEAVAGYERHLRSHPNDVEALGGLGFSLRAIQRPTDARRALLDATRLAPDDPRWWCDLGAIEEELGDFGAAEKCFRRALELKPNHPIAIAHLLGLRKASSDEDLVTRALRHVAADEIQKPVRVQLEFALGKHFDSVREYDRAFAHYAAANDLVEQGRPYDPAVTERQVEDLIGTFVPKLFESRRALGHASERPLFIVGMPRSGTTLTEQLLASHRDVAGAGELGYFNYAAHRFSARRSGADDSGYARDLDAADLAACAQEYLALLDGASRSAPRVVDKMPMNFLQVGLIALVFPKARIIHCRRDPLDTCLSCYFENFQEDQRYGTRLESVAHFYRHYERLMQHWRRAAPLPILDVRYEDVVADVETQARRLVEFCGLDWDPNCLEFHRTSRSVSTPSRWQVRQPIYGSSVARWRNYERHLQPLIEALS